MILAPIPLVSARVRERLAELLGLAPEAAHLDRALTHPSFANERRDSADNQRLEFLGDAVLGFCISELLYVRYPDADEGTLTRMRAQLVNAEALANFARRESIADLVRLGRGAEAAGLRRSTNVLADTVEALIAAAYLDGGIAVARALCSKIVEAQLSSLEAADGRDPKSTLQELVQAKGGEPPTYRVVETGGPAHDRWFVVNVIIDGRPVGEGRGRSKRQAERVAALRALENGASWQTPPAREGENDAGRQG